MDLDFAINSQLTILKRLIKTKHMKIENLEQLEQKEWATKDRVKFYQTCHPITNRIMSKIINNTLFHTEHGKYNLSAELEKIIGEIIESELQAQAEMLKKMRQKNEHYEPKYPYKAEYMDDGECTHKTNIPECRDCNPNNTHKVIC